MIYEMFSKITKIANDLIYFRYPLIDNYTLAFLWYFALRINRNVIFKSLNFLDIFTFFLMLRTGVFFAMYKSQGIHKKIILCAKFFSQ